LHTNPEKGNPDEYIGYFDLLKKCLRHAPRAAVLEHIRSLFKVFLEAFDGLSSKGDSVR